MEETQVTNSEVQGWSWVAATASIITTTINVSYSLNSLKGGNIREYIGDYYRGH